MHKCSSEVSICAARQKNNTDISQIGQKSQYVTFYLVVFPIKGTDSTFSVPRKVYVRDAGL